MNTRVDLNWVLNDLAAYPHARNAMIVTSDGLPSYRSDKVGDELADRVAAATSGLTSLGHSICAFTSDGPTAWQMNMTRFKESYVFIIAAGEGAFLVASAEIDVDVAPFTDRMISVVERMHELLGVDARQAGQG